MTILTIEGQVEDPEVESLRAEVRSLRSELVRVRADATRASQESTRALALLRKQLTPLYRALQAVFGEIDAAGVGEGVGEETGNRSENPRVSTVWQSWKSCLGGRKAQVIDALLVHGEMNTTQLAIAIGCNRNTIPNLIFELNKAGLLNKNAGRFSLKQL